ncbi:DUF91 domain-containing protein [Candidatus Woesearchaeota archaeon]|nr:DUF91 domain-containing protein [Candidatus Woesearchaeota archaeon]
MDVKVFAKLVGKSLLKNETVVAFMKCNVSYSGRAESVLGEGDRMIVIKSDNTVLVHQPEGNNPVNYMKPGSEITFEDNILHVFNAKEKAWLDVEMLEVYDVAKKKLEDGQKLDLAGNEKDMSDFLRDNPHKISSDFKPEKREHQTDVGFIDLFGHDGQGNLVVVECKRVTASLMAVDQLRRYVERVKQIKGVENVTGVLAAPGITPNAKEMLSSWGFIFSKVEPPKRLERWQKDQKSLAEF